MEKIIANILNIDQDKIRDEHHFIDDLCADSLHIVEIVMGIEEEYDITIPDDEIEEFITIGDIDRYITNSGSTL